MQQATGSVIKVRPAYMELAQPSFVPQVVSSPANIFVQEVLAQSYTKDRITWNFRSPSANLLCSPLIFGTMRLKLTTPYKLCKSQQIGPLIGSYDTNVALGQATADASVFTGVQGEFHVRGGYGYRPMFCFSSGNSVMNCCESKTISINGGTWSSLNENLYLRSLDECFVPRSQMQRQWSTCGGPKNANDSVGVSGHVLGLPDTTGYTGRDHGVAAGGLGATISILGVAHGAAAVSDLQNPPRWTAESFEG